MHKILATVLAVGTVLSTSAPVLATGTIYDQHNALVATLKSHGISLYLDADDCTANAALGGFYHSPSRSMVICNNGSTQMTEDNMDTLRHESIHVIQDCRDGVPANSELHRVLKPGVVEDLAARFGVDLDRITQIYKSHGRDAHVISLEHEAFTAAAGMSADTIARALDTMCAR